MRTSEGSFRVKPLDDALPLGAVPLGKATPAIAAALRGVRARRGVRELDRRRSSATSLNTRDLRAATTCPQPSAVDLTSYLPFLRLG